MKAIVAALGASRLAITGLCVLAALLALDRVLDGTDLSGAVVTTLAILAANLVAAFMVSPRLRRDPWLFIMHAGLLALVLSAAFGWLTRFEGHVEVLVGNPFDASAVQADRHGPWHRNRLPWVAFEQGEFSVAYAAGVRRARTESAVRIGRDAAVVTRMIGDDTPLELLGYRFYTTHNKGHAPVLRWRSDAGVSVTGAVHLPSYPLFDWKQANTWQPPKGPLVKFWFHRDETLLQHESWALRSDGGRGRLVVNDGTRRHELQPGESARLAGGTLSFVALRGWMGYRVYYDPTLGWMFLFAVVGIAGLAGHVLQQVRREWRVAPGHPQAIAQEHVVSRAVP